MEYRRETIPIPNLILDHENARHGEIHDQPAILRWMMTRDREKTFQLAKDIAEYGLSPIDEILVIPADKERSRFVVVEGNRRVTALKILAEPELCENAPLKVRIQALRKQFRPNIPDAIECVVVPTFLDAQHWIRLRHGGEQAGRGTVPWGAKESERFNSRIGHRGPNARALNVLDYAKDHGLISEDDLSRFPTTSLTRLLNDPDVRERMGLTIQDGKVASSVDSKVVDRALEQLLSDLASKTITVSDIKKKQQRTAYIKRALKGFKINPEDHLSEPYALIADPAGPATPPPSKRRRDQRPTTARKTIIPSSFIMHLDTSRLKGIYRELKELNVDRYPNAGAVLIRVFLEGCIDVYIESEKLSPKSDKLAVRVACVAKYMKDNRILTQQKIKPVEIFCSSPSSPGSVNTFNAYVHNVYLNPSPNDLKLTWDGLAPFFLALEGHV